MPLPPQSAQPPGKRRPPNALPDDRRAPGGPPDDPALREGVDDDKPGFTNANGQRNQLSGGLDVGEYLTVDGDPDQFQFTDMPDGDTIVTIGEPYERPQTPTDVEFYANLAEDVIPEALQGKIAVDLIRKIEMDKQARSKRDEQYEEGIRRTGLGKDAPGGAQFEGASKVVHPMMTEACIDYESRIIKEIWPIAGPVKGKIVGVATPEKTQRADRKVGHMNWQLTEQIKEARAVFETTLTQVPLGGVQYIRQWWDHRLERPRWQFVPIDDVYLPYSAADFQSSHRWTYSEKIAEVEFMQRVEQGVYRDIPNMQAPSQLAEPSKAKSATDKVEGVEDPGMNVDGEREIWNVMAYLEVDAGMVDALDNSGGDEEEGKLYPYLMAIDLTSKKILSFMRNWEQDDKTREPIEHLYEFPFIPWRGALSIGFPQIIGGLSSAATGALRALLDSAHASNSVTAYILKGAGISGQSRSPQIGEAVEIDAGLEAKDIRQVVMAPPFNPPSPVLFQLLGFLVDSAKGTVRTSMDETTIDSNSNIPVGTQLSRVEEGLVVFSAVHGRAHAAFNRVLAGLHRLNRLYLPDVLRVNREGTELLVRRADYQGPCDVQPVSDPTIYSDQQRFAQITAMEQAAVMFPQLYDIRAIQQRKLKLWKIPDIDEILKPEPKATEMNAVNENMAMTLGRPTVAFPEQDHLAHIHVHAAFMDSPLFGMNPLVAQTFLPLAVHHLIEHMAMLYVHHTVQVVKAAAGGTEAADLMSTDDAVKAKFDRLLDEATTASMPEITQLLTPVMQILQKAQMLMQQLAPKPPVDPNTAAATQAATQTAMAETQRKAAADQASQQQDQAELASTSQIKLMQIQASKDNAMLAAQTRLTTAATDAASARDIASMRIASGGQTGFSDGESLGH